MTQSLQEEHASVEANLNGWDSLDDAGNPKNWSTRRKWVITVITSVMTFSVTFASSVFSTAESQVAREFNVSHEVMVLGLSLFVFGFCFGPLLWGPLSEALGRKLPLMLGVVVFCIFQIPVALAKNVQTILICRFIGGMFASAALSIVGASLADIWNPVERPIAACMYSTATFAGPVVGPIVGGFLVGSHLGWRWTAWITGIQGFAFWILGMVFVPETHAPTLLRRRLKNRLRTADTSVEQARIQQSMDDHTHSFNLKEFATKYLTRPLAMLVSEPILMLITLYMSLVYGILYLFFETYPISFQEERGWDTGIGALPFLGNTVGVMCGNILIAGVTISRFKSKSREGQTKLAPEERLIPMMVGALVLPIGLFWYAWTSDPHITWVPEVLAGIPIGMGIQVIFTMGFNYILDVYPKYAASAVAANTFIRSTAGAGFPLFATPMYHKLGISWATSLLGFVSVALMPVPVLFFIYGKRIRESGRYNT